LKDEHTSMKEQTGPYLIGFYVFLYLLLCQACVYDSRSQQLPKTKPEKELTYDSARHLINEMKQSLKKGLQSHKISEDSVGLVYTNVLVNTIIPYWYGTTWDFNGYTAKPGEGAVACGYFVSTTLQHSGIKLNRYKMAQKSSMDGALMLEPKDSLWIKYCNREDFLVAFNKKCKPGLYMVGLSFHVGYLYKTAEDVYFIHSSYVSPTCVVQEKASESVALGQSKIFVIADITHNKKLMKKWLNAEEL